MKKSVLLELTNENNQLLRDKSELVDRVRESTQRAAAAEGALLAARVTVSKLEGKVSNQAAEMRRLADHFCRAMNQALPSLELCNND